MTSPQDFFLNRVQSVPFHGIGLSIDLYAPDWRDLVLALQTASLPFSYLELYRGPYGHLKQVRDYFTGSFFLEYHADGLWLTQPDFEKTPWEKECEKIRRDTDCLKSHWITHECATKQINGYFFGTYLPPLLTGESALLTARQSCAVQERFSNGPLLLLEIPPFYTFSAGDLSLAAFFSDVASFSPCGFLLDIGHVYTYYLSSGKSNILSAESYFESFLEEFPLERVVQIHLGGVRPFHQTFLDDHGGAIPGLLFDLLDQTLLSPRLTHLKGIALEVDTKSIDLILTEFESILTIGAGRMPLIKGMDIR